MNLEQLIACFREDARDVETPTQWSDETVTGWLNDAVAEAAVRGRLLLETEKPQVCSITLVPAQSVYPLHPALYEITYLAYQADGSSEVDELSLVSTEWLDRNHPGWRHRRIEQMRWAVQSERSIRLVPPPARSGRLLLEGYRLPLRLMSNPTDVPEIHAFSHDKLVLWALYRAFSHPDVEGFDAQRAAMAERDFTSYFGRRPDADLRRETREDVPHVTESIFL